MGNWEGDNCMQSQQSSPPKTRLKFYKKRLWQLRKDICQAKVENEKIGITVQIHNDESEKECWERMTKLHS